MNKYLPKNFLKKIEPYFAFKLLSSIFSQISSLFLIYLLPPKDYGYLALIISVSQVMFTLTSGWSNGAIINLGTKNYSSKGSYKDIVIYRGLIVIICFILISSFFLLLQSSVLEIVHAHDNLKYTYFLFLGYIFYDFSYQLLYPGNKNNLQAILEFIYTLSFLILMFLFVKNIKDYSLVFLFSSFLFFLITVCAFIYFFGRDKYSWNKEDFNLVLKYSAWQLMSVLGIYIVNLGNNYVFVLNNVSVESIGLYNFAFKLFSGFSVIFGLFGIIIPKWIHSVNVNHKNLMNKVYLIIFGLSCAYVLLALVVEPFIKLIGKSDYIDSVRIFYFLFPAFIFMSYVNLMNTIVANTKHYKYAQFAIVFQVIVIFAAGLPLIHFYGINGAIISATISYFICSIFFYVIYNKKIINSFKNGENW